MTLDRVSLHGELTLQLTSASITRSRIVNSKSLAPAISLRSGIGVSLRQTFVSGTLAVAVSQNDAGVSAVSSVLAGPLSGGTHTCTDTYGADYELLDGACQPAAP
jgi:hypothetical protein